MNNTPSPQEPSAQAMELIAKVRFMTEHQNIQIHHLSHEDAARAIDAHCAKQVQEALVLKELDHSSLTSKAEAWNAITAIFPDNPMRKSYLASVLADIAALRARANLADEMAGLLTEFLAVLENRASGHVVMYSERVVPFIPRIRSYLNEFNSAKAGQTQVTREDLDEAAGAALSSTGDIPVQPRLITPDCQPVFSNVWRDCWMWHSEQSSWFRVGELFWHAAPNVTKSEYTHWLPDQCELPIIIPTSPAPLPPKAETEGTDRLFKKWVSDPHNDGEYRLTLGPDETKEFFRDIARLAAQPAPQGASEGWMRDAVHAIHMANWYGLDHEQMIDAGVALLTKFAPTATGVSEDTKLEHGKPYRRAEDMSPEGFISIFLANDGDVLLEVVGKDGFGDRCWGRVEFCDTGSGGGRSPHTLKALRALAAAIHKDNSAAQSSQGLTGGQP